MAATWIIFLVVGTFSGYFIFNSKDHSNEFSKISAPIGSRSKIDLPDGSVVWLNAGSSLIYKKNFNGNTRKVKLTGEGFFKVATNRAKPFLVDANHLIIKAVGTTFNVKAYPEENKVITTLVEGKVELEGKINEKEPFKVIMKPNQKVVYYPIQNSFGEARPKSLREKSEIQTKPKVTTVPVISNRLYKDENVNTKIYTSWKDKKWIIEGKSLEDLSVMLDRRYDVKIKFNSDELKQYHFSGTIENETLEEVLDILRLTIPLSFRVNKGVVELELDNKLKKKYESAYR